MQGPIKYILVYHLLLLYPCQVDLFKMKTARINSILPLNVVSSLWTCRLLLILIGKLQAFYFSEPEDLQPTPIHLSICLSIYISIYHSPLSPYICNQLPAGDCTSTTLVDFLFYSVLTKEDDRKKRCLPPC